MELVEFLLARLAEDEQLAQAAMAGPWMVDDTLSGYGEFGIRGSKGDLVVSRGFEGDGGVLGRENADHIAHNNPARVLANVEAKRRIVKFAEIAREARNVDPAETMFMDFVLKNLAVPYSSHPDYQEEWRP